MEIQGSSDIGKRAFVLGGNFEYQRRGASKLVPAAVFSVRSCRILDSNAALDFDMKDES